MTPLQKPLKRLITINRDDYVVTLTPDGLKLTPKGKRKGLELRWEALVSSEAALAVALRASIGPSQPAAPHSHSTSRSK
jgi:hypothetical protein